MPVSDISGHPVGSSAISFVEYQPQASHIWAPCPAGAAVGAPERQQNEDMPDITN